VCPCVSVCVACGGGCVSVCGSVCVGVYVWCGCASSIIKFLQTVGHKIR
jgi:hypothetical protein